MKLILLLTILEIVGMLVYAVMGSGTASGVASPTGTARIVIIIVVLVTTFSGCWYIVLSGKFSPGVENWACGLIGSVFGFCIKWLSQ